MKTLILKNFEIRWNKWCPNQAWKRPVKRHNLVNVKTYLHLLKAFRIKNTRCFFSSLILQIGFWRTPWTYFQVDNDYKFVLETMKIVIAL